MKFYELPEAVNEAVRNTKIRPFVRILFELSDGDVFIPDSDIIEFTATSYKSAEGGIVNYGELVLDNSDDRYSVEMNREYEAGLGIEVWYCFGEINNTFFRFHLFADDSGFMNQQTGFCSKTTVIKLVDLSKKLDDIKLQKNWSDSQTFVDKVVCDKANPENSLVHIIAARGGIDPLQINCGSILFNIPYVVIENSAWKELCALANVYDACVECGRDMTLSFSESPYDYENSFSEEPGFFLTEKDITHFRFFSESKNYANNIRIKYTRYVKTKRQELWNYSDSPVLYDESLRPYYPFTDDSREILRSSEYEAFYTARNEEGKLRNVVYAFEIDSVTDFKNSLETDGYKPGVHRYDVKAYPDRAVLRLTRNNKSFRLYKACINGKAIISEPNFCIYVKDEKEIKEKGQIAKNFTSKFFSDDLAEGIPFYQKRAEDLLKESIKESYGYYITTYLPLIGARVNSIMEIRLKENGVVQRVRINEITFRYKKEEAFSTEIWVKSV